MKKIILFLFLCQTSLAQNFSEFALNKPWLLLSEENVTKSKILKFTTYTDSKLSINNMIWVFLTHGKLSYEYKSADDVDACTGVDFLDLDLDECRWRYDIMDKTLVLTLKGGYASIDDFVVSREYFVKFEKEGQSDVLLLTESKFLYLNDLTKIQDK